MRWVLLVALTTAAWADETRAWKGVITVRASTRVGVGSSGHEEQTEKIEFVLVTKRLKKDRKDPRVPLAMRNGHGTYSLRIDLTERHVATKGGKTGPIHAVVSGVIDPATGKYMLRVSATPRKLVALVLVSGMHRGGFRTWRRPAERRSFLAGFQTTGTVDGAVMSGRRKFVDRKAKFPRDVVIEWRIKRVDPVLRGRVVTHLGRPVAGVTLQARTTDPARARKGRPPHFRGGTSDKAGRFRLDAFWSHWRVRLIPFARDGVVYSWTGVEGFDLRFDSAPEKRLVMDAYRLADLPDVHLLEKHFRGDVMAYLNYIRPRVGEEKLRQLRLKTDKR